MPSEVATAGSPTTSHRIEDTEVPNPSVSATNETTASTPLASMDHRSNSATFTPEDLVPGPFPKAGPRKGRGSRERIRPKSQILTDTPVREKRRQAQEKTSRAKSSSAAKILKTADREPDHEEKKTAQKRQQSKKKTTKSNVKLQ